MGYDTKNGTQNKSEIESKTKETRNISTNQGIFGLCRLVIVLNENLNKLFNIQKYAVVDPLEFILLSVPVAFLGFHYCC